MREPALNPLVIDLLRHGYAVRFRAPGQSMSPTIADGAAIVVQPLTQDAPVHVGDVVLAQVDGRLLAHRVIGVAGEGATARFRLRGDAQTSVTDVVSRREILGRLRGFDRQPRRMSGLDCGCPVLTQLRLLFGKVTLWQRIKRHLV